MSALNAILGLVCLCSVVGVSSASPAAEVEGLKVKAGDAFRRGRQLLGEPSKSRKAFRQAAACIEKMRRLGASGPDFYLSQGNAEYLGGDLPAAVLAYRRGLQIDPGHSRLQKNLEAVRDEVDYPSAVRPPELNWPNWLPFPSPDFVFVAAFLFYAFSCVRLACWWRTRKRSSWLTGAATLAVASLLLVGWLWRLEEGDAREGSDVVVIAKNRVVFRQGNGASYPRNEKVPVLRSGMEARLRHRRGDWLQIEFDGGAMGWVRRDEVLLEAAS